MNKQLLPACLLAVSAGAATTFGGHAVGNGGDAVVCPAANGKISAELFDLYEGRTLSSQTPALDAASSLNGKLEIAFQRLERLSPERARIYRTQARSFFNEARFLRDQTLVDVPDSFEVALPTGCRLEQLAIQREPLSENDPRYVINGDLWDLLDENSRAGLVLHELIYREAVTYYHIDSKRVRLLNMLILSDGLSSVATAQDWMRFLWNTMQFLRTDAGGQWIRLGSCPQEYEDSEGRIRCVRPLNAATLMFHPNGVLWNAPLDLSSPSHLRVGSFDLKISNLCTDIGFHASGALESLCESRRDTLRAASFDIEAPFFASAHSGSWNPNGRLKSLILQSTTDLPGPARDFLVLGLQEAATALGDGVSMSLPWYLETRFREGRWLEAGTLAESAELTDVRGRRRHLAPGARIELDSSGRLVSCLSTPYASANNVCGMTSSR